VGAGGHEMALILVVDDEVLLSDILATMLIDDGHEAITAPHGRAALQMIRERKPALVITDFMMPLMTGLELAQAIRADNDLADLPLILVTGAQGHVARQHDDLFAVVIDKPYDRAELLAFVKTLVGNA
jgi:CheY-like chemotaxis protein